MRYVTAFSSKFSLNISTEEVYISSVKENCNLITFIFFYFSQADNNIQKNLPLFHADKESSESLRISLQHSEPLANIEIRLNQSRLCLCAVSKADKEQVWQLERMQNKPCWNSKLMGIHLAHNIRILKIKLKKKKLRPDFAPLNLLFFQCPFTISGRGAP